MPLPATLWGSGSYRKQIRFFCPDLTDAAEQLMVGVIENPMVAKVTVNLK